MSSVQHDMRANLLALCFLWSFGDGKLVEGLMVEFEEGAQKGKGKRLDDVRVKYLVFCFRVVNQKSCYYRYYTSICCLGC